MARSGSVLIAGVVAAALLAPGPTEPVAAQQPPQPARPPNFLVIITDDQRLETLDVMPRVRRWFQRGGTSFTNAYVTTPLCCPARASFFTGQYAHNHGVVTNLETLELDQRATVQRYLRERGYRTAIVGKYLNNWPLRRRPPWFHRWAVQKSGYVDRRFNENGRVRVRRGYTTDILADLAVHQVRRFARSGRPWLLFITPFAPHSPYTPAPRHRGASVPPWAPNPAVRDLERVGKPEEVLERTPFPIEKARRIRRGQLRSLMAVDELIGRVMREVAARGQDQDTLAVFTSDNGFFWGEFGLFDKRRPYGPGYHVPLFVRWPGVVEAGAEDDRLVANIDLAPTMLEAAGIEPDPDRPLDGSSLLGDHVRTRVLLEYFRHSLQPPRRTWASIRTPAFQYTEYYEDTRDGGQGEEIGFREYYDLAEDPWWLRNLVEDGDPTTGPSPAEVQVLSGWLAADRVCRGADGPAACP